MKAHPEDLAVKDLIDLRTQQMLVVNPEYQRGVVWGTAQKKKLVDSVLRGYPIPLIYLHHIKQSAGKLVSERYEVIDGQQRISALADYYEGAFRLFDPVKDQAEARFPDFVKRQPCPWGGKSFLELPAELQGAFLETPLRIVQIETHDGNEARDLFVRLQAGMPLNSQEKRDAWPGQFTDFILRLGGKAGLARYPGHDFFNVLMRAQNVKDRGKFRQLAAQIAMLFLRRYEAGDSTYCDTNAEAIDDFYYEHLGFNASSPEATRLLRVLDKITELLSDQKRSKLIGHEAIHLVLLVDSLLDDYTRSWESEFAAAFDQFRLEFIKAKKTKEEASPSDYWLKYGIWTRVNSDRGDAIQRRQEFFAARMSEFVRPVSKDSQRSFGRLERELIYYRDRKKCGVCESEVVWSDGEIHHVVLHSAGGRTTLENGALVHKHCHPKGPAAEVFARKWRVMHEGEAEKTLMAPTVPGDEIDEDDTEEDEGENAIM